MSDEKPKRQAETMADAYETYLEDIAPQAEKIMNDERLNSFEHLLYAAYWLSSWERLLQGLCFLILLAKSPQISSYM